MEAAADLDELGVLGADYHALAGPADAGLGRERGLQSTSGVAQVKTNAPLGKGWGPNQALGPTCRAWAVMQEAIETLKARYY